LAHKEHKRSGHSKRALRAGLIATLMAVVLVSYLLAFVTGCTASTPQRTVGDFISARIAGNEEKAAGLTIEEDLSGYMGGEPYLYAGDVTYELEQAQVDGDRTVVTVHYSWGDQSADIPYVTRRIGTKWKVALRETEELWLPEVEVEGETPGS
jgi:hypothetical protein